MLITIVEAMDCQYQPSLPLNWSQGPHISLQSSNWDESTANL